MTTFNTGNPIGSTDARDLSDNAENFDTALGTIAPTWIDRLGVTRDSFEGRLAKGSFYQVGTFAAGYTITNMRQTLEYSGHEYSWAGTFPKVVAAGATPATSGGIGAGAWVDRTDVALRSDLISQYGSSKVGFKQDGAGAVPTNVQSKLREFVSVKDFGAVGDGVTDDTAAIGYAIAYMASTGNNVLVNPGVYLCDSFSINSQVYAGQASFIGTDRERCIVRRRTAGVGAFVTYGASAGTVFQSGIGFERMTIDGGATTNGDAFAAYDLVRSQFRDVRFTGGSIACHLYGGISVSFYSCLFDAAKRGLKVEKFTSLAGGGWPNAIRVIGGEIVDNTECGAHFDNGRMFILEGVEIEGNGTTLGAATQGGVYIGANVGSEVSITDIASIGLIMRGCWLEANRGVADVSLNSGLNSIADSNFFSQSTMVTNDIAINGGKYMLRNLNMSFAKTVNVLEGGGVYTGNVIENVEGANFTYNGAKTTIYNGAWISLQQGRVPSVNGMAAPMILTGTDSTSANPTITFSTSFKSGTTPLVYCQVINNGPSTLDSPEIYSVSRSGFTLRKKTFNGAVVSTSNYSVSWVAIGESP